MPSGSSMPLNTLDAKALRRWLGEPHSLLSPVKNGVPNEAERRALRLRQNVEARLAQEFQVNSAAGKRWLEILDAANPSDILDMLRNSAGDIPPDVFARAFNESGAVANPPPWNADQIAATLADHYFSGLSPRIDAIFRDWIDSPPLQGWTPPPAEKLYAQPGGLAAIDYAIHPGIDPGETHSVIEHVLFRLSTIYANTSNASIAKILNARDVLRKSIANYARAVEAPLSPKAGLSRMSHEIQHALIQMIIDSRDQHICAAFAAALDQLSRQRALLDALVEKWNAKLSSARAFSGRPARTRARSPTDSHPGPRRRRRALGTAVDLVP